MKITFNRNIVSLVIITSLFCGNLHAHGVWVAQRTGEWTIVLGEGAVDDEYKPSMITSVKARGKEGVEMPIKLIPQARNVALELNPAVADVLVSYEDGYWSQGADGKWVAGIKRQVSNTKTSGYYLMYNRTIIKPNASLKPSGLRLEIVPLSDPMVLKKGHKLKVQVLFDGKPLVGAALAEDYIGDVANHAVKTDAKGRAFLKLHSSSLNVIKVSHNVTRADRSEVDEDGYAATLAFTLPQPKE